MSDKIMVEVVAFSDDYFEFYKGSLTEFKKHMDKAFLNIPKEYIESVKVEMDGINNYGSRDVCIKVTYERPESELEKSNREARESQIYIENKERELKQLLALQEKYKNE